MRKGGIEKVGGRRGRRTMREGVREKGGGA
jgi:hypothetical protein